MTKEYDEDFWGDPISIYTDADAISDGTLVDINSLLLTFESKPINRMTASLFWGLQPDYKLSDQQFAQVVLECGDDEDPVNFDHQAFARDLAEKLKQAGGSDRLRTIPPDMWLVKNELGGWTLMYPSDY